MISLLVALDQYHCRYAAATMAVLLFLPKPMAESGLTIAVAVVVVDDLVVVVVCVVFIIIVDLRRQRR